MFVDRRMFLLYICSAKKNPTVIFYTEGKNYEGHRALHNFAKKESSGSLLPDGKNIRKNLDYNIEGAGGSSAIILPCIL